MCMMETGATTPAKIPEKELSLLLLDMTDIYIPPDVLRAFVLNNWKNVTTLAHRIHENYQQKQETTND